MTDPTAAVTVAHPPMVVLRMANPILKLLLRSPIDNSLRRRYLTLSFTGRKSGRAYEFPIRTHSCDGGLYAITSAGWRLNFRGGAPVRITFDGRVSVYHAELIDDPEIVADLLVELTDGYGPKRSQHKLALKFNTVGAPTHDDFASAVRREKIAAIRFTEA